VAEEGVAGVAGEESIVTSTSADMDALNEQEEEGMAEAEGSGEVTMVGEPVSTDSDGIAPLNWSSSSMESEAMAPDDEGAGGDDGEGDDVNRCCFFCTLSL